MSDMADVILAHSSRSYELDYDGTGANGIWCDMCGEGEDFFGEPDDDWLAKHQRDMLAAAGFGLVREAEDEAWELGVIHGHNTEGRLIDKREANPYRAVTVRGGE